MTRESEIQKDGESRLAWALREAEWATQVGTYNQGQGNKPLKQSTQTLQVPTRGQRLYEITAPISEWVSQQRIQSGLLTIFCRHTSASLLIQENADPTVRADIEAYFNRLAPESGPYEHDAEGPDDMPAHLKTALTQVHLSIPVVAGRLALGTWQGIYLFEHRTRPHRREIALHLIGE
jgi:secondary thiamine-phosphate synthase enzyme